MNATPFRIALLAFATVLGLAYPFPTLAGETTVKRLMQRALPDFPGKEAIMLRVEYPPGHVEARHRHDAHVFVYVLEGSLEMQIEGSEPVVLNAGDTFYEHPDDVHGAGRNLSSRSPATLIVFFLKDTGKAPVLPPDRK
jgi:quercetin dioxygenase-like cupin family protein